MPQSQEIFISCPSDPVQADLKFVELAARMIADTVEEGQGRKIVVEKSTVPVKAAESISNILRHNLKPGVSFQVGAKK